MRPALIVLVLQGVIGSTTLEWKSELAKVQTLEAERNILQFRIEVNQDILSGDMNKVLKAEQLISALDRVQEAAQKRADKQPKVVDVRSKHVMHLWIRSLQDQADNVDQLTEIITKKTDEYDPHLIFRLCEDLKLLERQRMSQTMSEIETLMSGIDAAKNEIKRIDREIIPALANARLALRIRLGELNQLSKITQQEDWIEEEIRIRKLYFQITEKLSVVHNQPRLNESDNAYID